MARIANNAAPGTLFKDPRPARDKKYLAAIRKLPCLVCRTMPCGTAAHVRMLTGKNTLARKPSDYRTVPLCHLHHMEQHTVGEAQYWNRIGVDPVQVAEWLYHAWPNVEVMETVARVSGP